MKDPVIISLYKKPQTVFTLQEIAMLFPQISYINLKKRMSYYATAGKIKKIIRGIYAKDTFDVLELSNKLYSPSYVSLETVLQKAGVIFQYYERIFAVTYVSRTVVIGNDTIEYHRIRKEILLNKQGIEKQGNSNVASPERAFLDAVYLYKDYHFDNLGAINWDNVMTLTKLYHNRAFSK